MKFSFRIVLSTAFLVLAAPFGAHAESCSQTLNPGANVAAAAAAAPNGSTICLNSGDYGNERFTNIRRSDFVTLRSTTGVGARMSIGEIYGSNFLRFDSLSFNPVGVRECSTDIQLVNSTWVPGGDGLVFNYTTSCPQTDMRLLCTWPAKRQHLRPDQAAAAAAQPGPPPLHRGRLGRPHARRQLDQCDDRPRQHLP